MPLDHSQTNNNKSYKFYYKLEYEHYKIIRNNTKNHNNNNNNKTPNTTTNDKALH